MLWHAKQKKPAHSGDERDGLDACPHLALRLFVTVNSIIDLLCYHRKCLTLNAITVLVGNVGLLIENDDQLIVSRG